jgi:antitoxin VapB
MVKTAKLFQNGKSQAVRLPKEFRFEGTQVLIRKMGAAVVLLPLHHPWSCLFESLDKFSDDFMERREQPAAQQHREQVFH